MRLVNEFAVEAPLQATWAVLTDIPTVLGCIPGAELERRDGNDYYARVAVKVGPVAVTLVGTATVAHQDDEAREMVVNGSARDRKGNGSTEATVRLVAREDGDTSVVTVTTDVELSGRIAQFGRSVIVQVSNRIIGQFVARLNAVLAGADGPANAATEKRIPEQPMGLRDEWITLLANGFAGLALGLAVGRWLDLLSARPSRR